MKITSCSISTILLFLCTLVPSAFAANNVKDVTIEEDVCSGDEGIDCFRVRGWSKGNHALDCTIIVPDEGSDLPLIAWANGWDQGNVLGQCTTTGYLPGLKQWAKDGPYVVAAANQWSVQESDVLACVQWVVDNDGLDVSDTTLSVDASKVGLVGHSQGGGAVIKAGNGTKNGPEITTVLAMNPYGPSWVNPEDQDGQIFIVGGSMDTTTPPASYQAVWDAIKEEGEMSGPGGVISALKDGTHNSDAWGTDPDTGATLSCEEAANQDFGRYQSVGLLWWQIQLEDINGHRATLLGILSADPWENTETSNF
jgi:dienelactone hydrolase